MLFQAALTVSAPHTTTEGTIESKTLHFLLVSFQLLHQAKLIPYFDLDLAEVQCHNISSKADSEASVVWYPCFNLPIAID